MNIIHNIIILDLEVLFEKEYLIISWNKEELLVISHFLLKDKNLKKELLTEVSDRIENEEIKEIKEKLTELDKAIKKSY